MLAIVPGGFDGLAIFLLSVYQSLTVCFKPDVFSVNGWFPFEITKKSL